MSYFRNFRSSVTSQVLSKPNNLVLKSCHLPKILSEGSEPSLSHLHSVKALFNTISVLKSFEGELEEEQYRKEVQSELRYLGKVQQQYQSAVRKYVENNGYLTGEAIANIYASASELGLSSDWLQLHIHKEITSKASYMSRLNLTDTINGVKANHPSSPDLQMLQGLLKQKSVLGEPVYVEPYFNESTQFDYTDNVQSNHDLIRAIRTKQSFPLYFALKNLKMVWSRALEYARIRSAYNLHNE